MADEHEDRRKTEIGDQLRDIAAGVGAIREMVRVLTAVMTRMEATTAALLEELRTHEVQS